jgi:hypothetical protein
MELSDDVLWERYGSGRLDDVRDSFLLHIRVWLKTHEGLRDVGATESYFQMLVRALRLTNRPNEFLYSELDSPIAPTMNDYFNRWTRMCTNISQTSYRVFTNLAQRGFSRSQLQVLAVGFCCHHVFGSIPNDIFTAMHDCRVVQLAPHLDWVNMLTLTRHSVSSCCCPDASVLSELYRHVALKLLTYVDESCEFAEVPDETWTLAASLVGDNPNEMSVMCSVWPAAVSPSWLSIMQGHIDELMSITLAVQITCRVLNGYVLLQNRYTRIANISLVSIDAVTKSSQNCYAKSLGGFPKSFFGSRQPDAAPMWCMVTLDISGNEIQTCLETRMLYAAFGDTPEFSLQLRKVIVDDFF